MNIRTLLCLWIFCGGLAACSPRPEPVNSLPMAIKMADTYIVRYDTTLVNYSEKWSYDVALLARAYYDLFQVTHDSVHLEVFTRYMDFFVTDTSVWNYTPGEYSLDRIQPARNLFFMAEISKEPRWEKAIQMFARQLKDQPRNAEGGFWHKKSYPNQMWLDGIYMACPFMAQYAQKYNKPEWYDEAVKQITLIYKHTRDSTSGLLYHAWDQSLTQKWADPKTGHSPNFWSRATGWYMMALVDVLDYLPQDHPGRPEVIRILQDLSAALLRVQDPELKLWYQVLDQGGKKMNYREASGSAMIIYTYAKGARLGYLKPKYRDIAGQAFNSLTKNLTKVNPWTNDLEMFYICASCGLGGDPYRDGSYEYYVNEKIKVNDPKGTAPYMLAAIELNTK